MRSDRKLSISVSHVTCPTSGGYTGDSAYIGQGPQAAPLLGSLGCVDSPMDSSKLLIYGPFEDGFPNSQLVELFNCANSSASISGRVDTKIAGEWAAYQCDVPDSDIQILDDCGGHAVPYHYHEKMTCLYTQNSITNHSTRVGTALDGNGIYGKYINGGVVPRDLDACGGRSGVTPDSNGSSVYYYVVQDTAPFSVGCFGPVDSVEECRALYDTCGDGDEITIKTSNGNVNYDPFCPCFENGTNVYSDTSSSELLAPTSAGSTLSTTIVLSLFIFNLETE